MRREKHTRVLTLLKTLDLPEANKLAANGVKHPDVLLPQDLYLINGLDNYKKRKFGKIAE